MACTRATSEETEAIRSKERKPKWTKEELEKIDQTLTQEIREQFGIDLEKTEEGSK